MHLFSINYFGKVNLKINGQYFAQQVIIPFRLTMQKIRDFHWDFEKVSSTLTIVIEQKSLNYGT